ncbi:peptidase C39 [Roseiconus nitratireducens]|uniref:Peptidase C39 n=1 Tax=Roseiconus nitratireducens TaxID=2605748 RepID=A0A5M6D7G3_9BACT|nr:C39 family peptidase [Roseiconus nitratireducens]KAA5542596.1 peptidase C39 [Roseiconus nitratireducens]
MQDLYLAVLVMAVASAVAGLCTGTWAWSDKGQRVILLMAVAIFSAVIFQFYGAGQLFWATVMPSSAAIIYSNVAPVLIGASAGWATRVPGIPRGRRAGLALALSLTAVVALFWPLLSILLRPPPEGADHWDGPVALQTSWATCSPAAAATLLRGEGIPVSEREMIPLCLTDSAGTPTLGLYRGVKLIANRQSMDVRVVERSLQELIEQNRWPVLIAVKLPYGVSDPRYVEQWGWIPGMGHSVVIAGFDDGHSGLDDATFVVADPSTGLERWSIDDMRVLWHGDGIRLVDSE